MKPFGAVFVTFVGLAVGPLSAQYRSVGGFGNVAFPGLGHAPAGGNPWGNVVFPAIPQGSAAFSSGAPGNRYGSLVPGFHSYNGTGHGAGNGYRRGSATGVYFYPVYVGGLGYGYGPAQPDQPSSADTGGSPPAQPPVVINQYFGTAPPDQGPPPDAAASDFHYYQAPSNSDTVSSDTSYYLVAFKDHTIYSAVAYYIEGDTLHYFTSGNVHNQVSLSLVDRQLTEQLNRERNVDVRMPR